MVEQLCGYDVGSAYVGTFLLKRVYLEQSSMAVSQLNDKWLLARCCELLDKCSCVILDFYLLSPAYLIAISFFLFFVAALNSYSGMQVYAARVCHRMNRFQFAKRKERSLTQVST